MSKSTKSKLKSYELKPLTDYLRFYKENHKIIVDYVENLPPTVPIPERQRIYNSEVAKLRSQFSIERQKEYESKSVELSVAHSCTSSSSSGKNCGWRCVDAPTTGMYTSMDGLIRVEGTAKEISVGDNPAQACIRLSVAGKGKNKGILFATFKYRTDFIISSVQSDTATLFNLVINDKDSVDLFDERKGIHLIYDEIK